MQSVHARTTSGLCGFILSPTHRRRTKAKNAHQVYSTMGMKLFIVLARNTMLPVASHKCYNHFDNFHAFIIIFIYCSEQVFRSYKLPNCINCCFKICHTRLKMRGHNFKEHENPINLSGVQLMYEYFFATLKRSSRLDFDVACSAREPK